MERLGHNKVNDTRECMVVVYMPTYNHERYIHKAINGVLMQQTDHSLKLIIAEDHSTDRTRDICIEYKQKYPEIIELILAAKNTNAMIRRKLYERCYETNAKYIAFCEGDDHWTDPLKVQRQVDFLESHPEYSLCFHNTIVERDGFENNGEPYLHITHDRSELTLEDMIRTHVSGGPMLAGHTSSCVARNREVIGNLPEWFFDIISADLALFVLWGRSGKIHCMSHVMSKHIRHPNGESVKTYKERDILIGRIEQCQHYKTVLDIKYHAIIDEVCAQYGQRLREKYTEYV
ncbi:MAG: glycosyltransferase [Candidatus Omnitrophica bacterium]|nr:glycosyltransferase [Candidatus Omnitrophota bacterium]